MINAVDMPIRQIEKKEKASLPNMLWDLPYIFIAGGLIGTVYEFLLVLFTTGMLEDHSGSILTPFNYIYGTGAVVMFIVLYRMKNPVAIFAVGSLLGGVVEFGLSLGQEMIFGCVSWDYSEHFMNIGGRTTVPYMLVWGLLCLVAVKFIFPLMLKGIYKIPTNIRKTGAILILCLMCVDIALTGTATIRYMGRAAGTNAGNIITRTVDRLFNDKFMLLHFPNMMIR